MQALIKSLLSILLLASCVGPRRTFHRLENGVVRQVTVDLGRSSGLSPLWGALWLAAIGSGIGSGATASAIGAGSGALVGGTLGYAHDRRISQRVNRRVEVVADSGVHYHLPAPKNTPLHPGQRVWIDVDASGRPHQIIAAP